jgi:hypothetical protein
MSAYDPNKQGWGAAAVTCLLTAALGFTAYTIHKNTYRHPRDPMAVQVYHAEDLAEHSGAKAEHGEAKAEGAKAEGAAAEGAAADAPKTEATKH